MNYFRHFVLCYPNRLRLGTWLAFIATAVFGGILSSLEHGWSPTMKMHSQMGFADAGTQPIHALTTAKDADTFRQLLADPQDREVLTSHWYWDFGFIASYGTLLTLLIRRHPNRYNPIRALQFLVLGGAILCDLSENISGLYALEALRLGEPTAAGSWLLPTFSAWKMALFLLTVVSIGIIEFGAPVQDQVGSFVRLSFAVITSIGAGVGLSYFYFGTGLLLENGVFIVGLGGLLIPFWIWNPDRPWTK